jgi:hypothetical protein
VSRLQSCGCYCPDTRAAHCRQMENDRPDAEPPCKGAIPDEMRTQEPDDIQPDTCQQAEIEAGGL